MLYLISYDLHRGATLEDHKRFGIAISNLGGRQVLESQWAIRSRIDARALFGLINSVMNEDDRLLITEVTDNWAGVHTLIDLNLV